jgi:hypothetical protein
VIVRIATEDQYRLSDDHAKKLNDLDNQAVEAVEAGDEARFQELFDQMLKMVRDDGEVVPDDEIAESDVILPPPDTTIEDAREEFTGEGLIPN